MDPEHAGRRRPVVIIEAPDIQAAMGTLASSEEPFDNWFREHIRDVHGIDLAEDSPPPEQVLDFHAQVTRLEQLAPAAPVWQGAAPGP